MSDYMTVDHRVKKKQKTGDISFLENVCYSEHSELEGSGKKKKRKRKHDETLMDSSFSGKISPSCSRNSFVEYGVHKDTSELASTNQDCNSSSQKSAKKSKKKKQMEESVEETVEEADHIGHPSLYDVKHKHTDDETFTDISFSGKLSPSCSRNSFVEYGVHKDTSELVSTNQDCNSSSQKSAKKSKKKKQIEESMEETVEEADHIDYPSLYDGHSHTEEALLSESVRKKKKRKRCPESRSLEEDPLVDMQPTSPLITLNENTYVEDSVRKKKKRSKSTETLKANLSDDFQQSIEFTSECKSDFQKSGQKGKDDTPSTSQKRTEDLETESKKGGSSSECEVSRKLKKKKNALVQKISSELTTKANSPFNDESECETVVCLSPKAESPQKVTLTKNMSFNGETNLESSRQKKKKMKHLVEDYSQTESMCFNRLKIESSSEPVSKDNAVAAGSEEDMEKNLDVSDEEAFEKITEATNSKNDDIQTSAKSKKSKDWSLDASAEFEYLNTVEMANAVNKATIDPMEKDSVWLKRCSRSASVSEVLNFIRGNDVVLLEEYFPKIRSWSVSTVSDLISCDLKRIKDAKAKGIKFETGRFVSSEDELIKKNVEDFKKLIGLESAEMLFHAYRFPNRKSTLEKLKKKFHFRQRIAQGLARTVADVSRRGAKLYDLSGKKGRFSKEETEKLQKCVSKHGNRWTVIAPLIGRDNHNTQLKASQLRREVTGGKWSIDEVNRLIQSVKEFALSSLKSKKSHKVSKEDPQTIPKELLFTGIPWVKIEEKVETRNWTHCKSKWNDILLLRMNDGISPFEGIFGLHTSIEMIKWLHNAQLPRGQVNWLEMAKAVGNIPPGILQQKVYKLKSRNVPNWQRMSFEEIVNFLHKEVLPTLEINLKGPIASQNEMDMPEKKDEFLITDIFKEYV